MGSKVVVIDFSRRSARRRALTRAQTDSKHALTRFLTTKEVARILGYSERTITSWASAWHESGGVEGIPCYRYGRRKWSFDEGELRDWIDNGGLSGITQLKKTGT